MIKIDPNGWILGAAYTRWKFTLPTNLCTLFWKTLGLGALGFFLGVVAVTYLFGAVWIWFDPNHIASAFFGIVSIFGSFIALCAVGERYSWGRAIGNKYRAATAFTLDQQWRKNARKIYAGFKEKFCPLVGWTE